MNFTTLLNHTTVEEQVKLQDTMSKTTKEVRYDARPTQMVIVQQIPQKAVFRKNTVYRVSISQKIRVSVCVSDYD